MTIAEPLEDHPSVRLFIGWQATTDMFMDALRYGIPEIDDGRPSPAKRMVEGQFLLAC